MTSDGLPQEEMDINISIGQHENLVDVLAQVKNHPLNKDALMLELIPSRFFNLGLPPSLESCTRDVYPSDFKLSTKAVLKIVKAMASAGVHIHQRGIMHGDFYAHNIMIDVDVNAILGDFGGASYYESEDFELNDSLEKLEIRAFGCLIEELLELSKEDNEDLNIKDFLFELQKLCFNEIVEKRPSFEYISKKLTIF
jgi:serine/threonine protein kinase